MDVEERVRTGLGRNASSFEPDTAAALDRVRRRRRHVLDARPLLGVAAAIVVVVVLVALTRQRPDAPSMVPVDDPAGPSAAMVAGRFEAVVPPLSGDPDGELTGRWVIDFGADGTVEVGPPSNRGRVGAAPTVTATVDELTIGPLSVDLCDGQPPGRYHWSVAPWGDLDLGLVDDDCAARIELLTGPGRTWAPVPPAPPSTEGT